MPGLSVIEVCERLAEACRDVKAPPIPALAFEDLPTARTDTVGDYLDGVVALLRRYEDDDRG